MIPMVDLKTQYHNLKAEIDSALHDVLENTQFILGPNVREFEKEVATNLGVKHALSCASGTDALHLALLAAGIGEGDEVITSAFTFIATAEAISLCGATPVFVDIDEQTYTLDPQKLEDYLKIRITKHRTRNRPKAVIPVHIFGQMADMDPIVEISRKYELYVIEDACQAHGAEYKGRRAGSIGDAGCFSFYPGKNLGAYGEAGAVTINNGTLAEEMAKFRDHGQSKKYYHEMIGWNARMDGFQGAVLNVKLKHLSDWNEARRNNAVLYNELLTDINGIIKPVEAEYAKHVYHVYALRLHNREKVIAGLSEEDIYCGIHYPVPVHLQDAYQSTEMRNGSCPTSEKCAEEYVSLPMFPELTRRQIEYVAESIKNIVDYVDKLIK